MSRLADILRRTVTRPLRNDIHTLRYAIWKRLPISRYQIKLARIQNAQIRKLEHEVEYWRSVAEQNNAQAEEGRTDA